MQVIQIYTPYYKSQDKSFYEEKTIKNEYHILSWTLSCLQLRKHYENVKLITNAEGKELLIDHLCLPYTEWEIIPDEALNECYSFLLVLGARSQPFILVDKNVFLWSRLNVSEVNQGVCGFFYTRNDEDCFRSICAVQKRNIFVPSFVEDSINVSKGLYSFDTSVVGFTDMELYAACRNEMIDFIKLNKRALQNIDVHLIRVYLNNYFLFRYARAQNKLQDAFIEDTSENSQLSYYQIFELKGRKAKVSYVPKYQLIYKEIVSGLYYTLKRMHPAYVDMVANYVNTPKELVKYQPAAPTQIVTGPAKDHQPAGNYVHPEGSNPVDKLISKYSRTLASIGVLDNSHLEVKAVRDEKSLKSLVQERIDLFSDASHRRFVEDVLGFESKRSEYIEKMSLNYSDSGQVKVYESYERFVSLDLEGVQEIILSTGDEISFVESEWDWSISLDVVELARLKVIYNVANPAAYFQTLLLPQRRFLMNDGIDCIREYNLSDIEIIIFHIFSLPTSIKQAFTSLVGYLNQDITIGNSVNIQNIFLDRIKEFVFLGALKWN